MQNHQPSTVWLDSEVLILPIFIGSIRSMGKISRMMGRALKRTKSSNPNF